MLCPECCSRSNGSAARVIRSFGTTNTAAGAKKGRTLKSWHLLPPTQNREEPRKDFEIVIEPETSFEKHNLHRGG
jgi:hypothetical protein